jgi:hypothetical protein
MSEDGVPAGTSERVSVESPLHPGRLSTVEAAMYVPVRDALLWELPDRAPGLTLGEARSAVFPRLPEDLFPGGSKAGWYFKVVQLDLEAKGVIAREPVTPLRIHRVAAG